MARSLRLAILSLLALASSAFADHVILTGGPALRKWEDLRTARDQHDRWWANFIRASTLRMDEIRKAYGPSAPITWIVYRTGYEMRGRADSQPYTRWIAETASKRRVTLLWFDSTSSLISTLNGRPTRSVETFDYFGHSNRYCFMMDYGSTIMGASTVNLHQDDLRKIRSSIFSRNAYCKSWGCHTAESMSGIWESNLGVKLEGADGPTDYSFVGKGELPHAPGWVR
jgi:hypothetical protein